MVEEWNHKIFGVEKAGFEALALEIYAFQFRNNAIYRAYSEALGLNDTNVKKLADIPFLPIRFFKTHTVTTTDFPPQAVFESSGTTGTINSRHLVKQLSLYEESFTRAFESFYGPVNNWCIIGLLPSYLERTGSSLVYMVDQLIQKSGHPQSGFYLNEHDQLAAVITELEKHQQPTLIIGATFGLLDFAAEYQLPLKHTWLMETGGMKGRRKELIRQEVHELLQQSFGMNPIHSEYGMTELLSQAYSKGQGIFECSDWMRVLVREEEDPLQIKMSGSGLINVIDLANIYSCAFIATDDAGQLYPDGKFEVLGRMDNSDIRGCSLLVM